MNKTLTVNDSNTILFFNYISYTYFKINKSFKNFHENKLLANKRLPTGGFSFPSQLHFWQPSSPVNVKHFGNGCGQIAFGQRDRCFPLETVALPVIVELSPASSISAKSQLQLWGQPFSKLSWQFAGQLTKAHSFPLIWTENIIFQNFTFFSNININIKIVILISKLQNCKRQFWGNFTREKFIDI